MCSLNKIVSYEIHLRNWFEPLGSYLGIKYSVHKKPSTNDLLEAEYKKITKDKQYLPNLQSLSEQLNTSDRQIQIWLRRRKLHGTLKLFHNSQSLKYSTNNAGKPTKMVKFCETGWRCLYYTAMTLYGVWCLWDKPWLWNILDCW